MPINPNITFNMTKGNPNNDPVGFRLDKQVYGKSLGGTLFDSDVIGNTEYAVHFLRNGSEDLFDVIVPTDIIKSNINYRAIFIVNRSGDDILLNNIVCSNVIPDPLTGLEQVAYNNQPYPLTDVNIAIEGVYTIPEIKRAIPTAFGRPGNPSLVIDDEYDSTTKLSTLVFSKNISYSEIPANCAMKIWVKRSIVTVKSMMPEREILESFVLTVNETNGSSTSLTTNYRKLKGRIPLSNWFNSTITPGIGSPVVIKELLPKEVLVSDFNIIKTFVIADKILIFYNIVIGSLTNYFMLVVQPNDDRALNKYIQIELQFTPTLSDGLQFNSRNIVDIYKSYYDANRYYLFWNEEIGDISTCHHDYFGYYSKYNRIAVDELFTHIWTGEVFSTITPGYDNRRFETYKLPDYKIIRDNKKIINVDHFDDMFMMFVNDTKNAKILTVDNNTINKNELIYVFEKDIIDPKNFSSFKHYPGSVDSQVFSQRLYPPSIPKERQRSTYNYAKNADSGIIISNSSTLDTDIVSHRRIKYLADGTRYIDFNSFHGREFKVGNRFITYELPNNQTDFTSSLLTVGLAIENDSNIYSEKLTTYPLNDIITNINQNNEIVELPVFHQNIITGTGSSQSVPLEWVDRTYKDEWKTIIATVPTVNVLNETPAFTLQYNFKCNHWKTTTVDISGNINEQIMSYSVSPSGTCKEYKDVTIDDLPYVFEPDTYQPLSIQISTKQTYSSSETPRYFVLINIYFKGVLLGTTTTYTSTLSNMSYLFVNPDKSFNARINYFDVKKQFSSADDIFYISSTHRAILNNVSAEVGKEQEVNPQLNSNQSDFKYYRNIKISGFITESSDISNDISIPIIIYGNGYKNDDTNATSLFLGVVNSFDFSKNAINDKSIRLYSESNTSTPIKFRVGYYDYSRDYAVIWVRLQDINIHRCNLIMYYGKYNTTENKSALQNTYAYLSNNLYPVSYIGSWHFDNIIDDDRLSFTTGRLFNVGDPVVYEKSSDGHFFLNQIDKEYMYGVAKVFKSHKFNVELTPSPLEDPLNNESTKEDFQKFITDAINVFKPSYTEINNIKPFGIGVYESGEDTMGPVNNRRVTGLIALSPNDNVNTYYSRTDNTKFDALTSFGAFTQKIDWIVAQPTDTSVFKSGVLKINGKTKTETIRFKTPFKDKNYFVFVSSPTNQKVYWNLLCQDRFTVTGSYFLEQEVCWLAFHKDVFGGVFTPDSIYVGKRTITGKKFVDSNGTEYPEYPGDDNTLPDFPSPTVSNLSYWYNNEIIIEPDFGVEGEPGVMNIDPTNPGYSVILSSNENINSYWVEKEANRFRVRTSSPAPCILHYLVVRTGVEWWSELI